MSELRKQHESPFWDYINMKEVVSKDGQGVVEIDVFPHLFQRRERVHGGVIATLIDASIGSAVRSLLDENEVSATVELKTNFFRPATSSKLISKASIKQRGKTLAIGTSEVVDDKGKLIAIGSATFIIQGKS